MTESWYEDNSGGCWRHHCKWAKFEFRLGPTAKQCIYTHTGVCDAKIPDSLDAKKPEVNNHSSWSLKKTPKPTSLDSFK